MTESGYQLTGVPYHEQDVFELQSFHFHFGRFNGEGFEHTIDGNPYSGEVGTVKTLILDSYAILAILAVNAKSAKINVRQYYMQFNESQTGEYLRYFLYLKP